MGKKGKKGKKSRKKKSENNSLLDSRSPKGLKYKLKKKFPNPPIGTVIPIKMTKQKEPQTSGKKMTIPEQIENAENLLIYNLKENLELAKKRKQAPKDTIYDDEKIKELLSMINDDGAFESEEEIIDRLKDEEKLHPEIIKFILYYNDITKKLIASIIISTTKESFCISENRMTEAMYNPQYKKYICLDCGGRCVPIEEAAQAMAEKSSSSEEYSSSEESSNDNLSYLTENDRKLYELFSKLEPEEGLSPMKQRLQNKLEQRGKKKPMSQKGKNWELQNFSLKKKFAEQAQHDLLTQLEQEKSSEINIMPKTIEEIEKLLEDPKVTGNRRKKLKRTLKKRKKKKATIKKPVEQEKTVVSPPSAIFQSSEPPSEPSKPLTRAVSPVEEYLKQEIKRAREKLIRRGPPADVEKLQFGLADPIYTSSHGKKLEEGDLLDVISQKNSPAIWLIDRTWELMEQNIENPFEQAEMELGKSRAIFGDPELTNISRNEIKLVIFLLKNHSDKLYIYGGIPRDLLQGDIKTKDVDIGLKNDEKAAMAATRGDVGLLDKLFLEAENLLEEYAKGEGFQLIEKKKSGVGVRTILFDCGGDCRVDIEITSPSFFQIKAKKYNAEGPDLDVNNLKLVIPNQGVGQGEGYMFSFVHPFGQNFKEIKRNIRNKRMQLMKPFAAFAPSQPILPRLEKYLQRGWSIKINKDYIRFEPIKGKVFEGHKGFTRLKDILTRQIPNIEFKEEGDFYILNKKVRGGKRTRKRRRKKRKKTRHRKKHYRKRSRKRKKRRIHRKSKKN